MTMGVAVNTQYWNTGDNWGQGITILINISLFRHAKQGYKYIISTFILHKCNIFNIKCFILPI